MSTWTPITGITLCASWPSATSRNGAGLAHCPSGVFTANAAWAVLATLGADLTIDIDSSVVETYGLAKQGGSFTYTGVRG